MSTIGAGSPRKRNRTIILLAVMILLLLLLVNNLPMVIDALVVTGLHLSQGVFLIVDYTPPYYMNVSQSLDIVEQWKPITLSSAWIDRIAMDYAWLATNESGAWANHSGIYGSPIKIGAKSGWSNFTWMTTSFTGTVGWRIYANDTAGNLNVTEIMTFDVIPGIPPEEPPSPGPSRPPVVLPVSNFTVDKEFIKAVLQQGETFLDSVEIKNNGERPLKFNITIEGLKKYVVVSEDSFSILQGESKTITVAFTVMENAKPDVYTGRMLIEAGGIKRVVLLIVEVKEKKALFDIYLSLEETPIAVMPGEEVEADILLYNFGDLKPVDVTLYYSLRDFDGKDLLYKYDTLAVEEQRLVKRKIRIPDGTEPGFYVFYARVEYDNQTASSSGLIKVVREKVPVAPEEIPWPLIVAVLAAALAAALLFILIRRPDYRRKIIRKYERYIPYSNIREKLRIARMSREKAEELAEKRRIERLEAEMMAEKEREERLRFEKMIGRERVSRKMLSERLKKKKGGRRE